MISFCLFPARLCAIVAGVLACVQSDCTASPPVWQPYRETIAHTAKVEVIPAQYPFVEPQPERLPVEALTDADLAHLCCGGSYYPAESHGESFVDPILESSVNISSQPTTLEVLPGDLLWHSYWAGAKEPRTSGVMFRDSNRNLSLVDISLGGRASMFRVGDRRSNGRPLGWELQIEGAAQLRLNLD